MGYTAIHGMVAVHCQFFCHPPWFPQNIGWKPMEWSFIVVFLRFFLPCVHDSQIFACDIEDFSAPTNDDPFMTANFAFWHRRCSSSRYSLKGYQSASPVYSTFCSETDKAIFFFFLILYLQGKVLRLPTKQWESTRLIDNFERWGWHGVDFALGKVRLPAWFVWFQIINLLTVGVVPI